MVTLNSVPKLLSRRDFLKLSGVASLSWVLSACSPTPTPTPAAKPTPTATPTPTHIPLPTNTPTLAITPTAVPTGTPTLTPKPTVPLQGLQGIPYPDAGLIRKGITKFGLPSQVVDADKLIYEVKSNLNDPKRSPIVFSRHPVTNEIILTARINPITKEFEWDALRLRDLADALGTGISVTYYHEWVIDRKDEHYIENIRDIGTDVFIAGETGWGTVFKEFSGRHWQQVLNNWESIKANLDQGIIPSDFPYDWRWSDRVVKIANQYALSPIRGTWLLNGGDDLPDAIYTGNFNDTELSRILEFAVKVRVLKYKGVISIWDGCDEAADALFNPNNGKWSFWYDRLGIDIIHNSFVWAHQADPNAKLIIVDHPILESTKGAPPLETRVFEGIREKFFQLLRMFKERNTPVDGVDIENNFWIYAPPSYDDMVEILGRIKGMGYKIYAPETMVNTSEYYIPWRERSKQTSLVVDKETAQAQIYADVARAYLDIGAHIGFGGVNDAVNWMTIFVDSNANPTLFDKDGNPKKAYFSVKKVLEQKISTRTS